MTVKALIQTYNGGRYGRGGEYIRIIEPDFFKNGNMKKSKFRVIEVIEVIKKEYSYMGCNHSEKIAEVLEVLEP